MNKQEIKISINPKTWAGARFCNLANARTKSAGFTLLELLLTIAILAVVAIFGSINLINYYSRQNLNLTVDEIIAFLRDAQNRSITQESGDQWGVHFSNTTSTKNFQLFHGPDFASGTLAMSRDLRVGVQFVAPAAGTSTDIIFSKVTGYPNATTSIVLILGNNPNQAYTITINAVGVAAKTLGTF